MDEKNIQQLIAKYKEGLCDEDEIKQLHNWVDDQGFDEPEYRFTDSDHEYIVKETIRANINRGLFGKKPAISDARPQLWLKVAALLLLACSVGFLIWNSTNSKSPEVFTTIYNPPGQLKTVVLPDGSKVILNAATTIRFSNQFNIRQRKINLSGEAYFDVVHNTAKPFIVCTRNINTQDIGTSFNIKAYNDEPEIKVAVMSGKVGVTSNQSSITAVANQAVDYTINTGKLFKTNLDDAGWLKAWTEGQLIFKNQSLNDISRVLMRHYNIHIIILNGRLGSALLNARFDKNESTENIINVLCTYVGARYRHNSNTYTIQ